MSLLNYMDYNNMKVSEQGKAYLMYGRYYIPILKNGEEPGLCKDNRTEQGNERHIRIAACMGIKSIECVCSIRNSEAFYEYTGMDKPALSTDINVKIPLT